MELVIPDVGVPSYEITIGEQRLSPDVKADIMTVELSEEVDLPAMLTFTLNVWDGFRGELKQDHLSLFQLGTAVKFAVGINDTSPIFEGEVTALEPSFGSEEGGDTLTIRALDRLHRLRFGTKQRTFKSLKDSDIAASIADEVGLKSQVDDTTIKHAHVTQKNVNNLTFLLSRAKPINYEVKVDGATLLFRKNQEAKGPSLTLEYRKDLIRFAPRQRAIAEGTKVEVRGWDAKNKKLIIAKSGAGDETSKMGGKQTGAEQSASAFGASTRTITDQPVADAEEAQKIATAWFNRQQQDFVEADGECPGTPLLRAGQTIEVTNVGKPFSGTYYVTGATHKVGSEGYRTQFKVRRKAL